MSKSSEGAERRAAFMRAGAEAAERYREGVESRMGSFSRKLNAAMREAAERKAAR